MSMRSQFIITLAAVIFLAGCKQTTTSSVAASSPVAPPSSFVPSPGPNGSGDPSQSVRSQQQANSAQLEDVEHRYGPYLIGKKEYTVVISAKHTKDKSGPDSEAAVSLEIRDASGAVVHRQTFEYSFDRNGFTESCNASADILSGSMGKWLLVTSDCEPSAPESGGPWEIFGDFNGNLRQYGGDIYTQGEMLRFIPGAVTKVGAATSYGFDSILFKVWAGNFHVTLPVKIDFAQPKLEPGIRCLGQTGRGLGEIGCEVPVEAMRSPAADDTFVRLFEGPQQEGALPAHVVVHPASKVEFLSANVRITFDETNGSINLGVADDQWLKVRIDGKVGWIHTQEDFAAIGLPEAG